MSTQWAWLPFEVLVVCSSASCAYVTEVTVQDPRLVGVDMQGAGGQFKTVLPLQRSAPVAAKVPGDHEPLDEGSFATKGPGVMWNEPFGTDSYRTPDLARAELTVGAQSLAVIPAPSRPYLVERTSGVPPLRFLEQDGTERNVRGQPTYEGNQITFPGASNWVLDDRRPVDDEPFRLRFTLGTRSGKVTINRADVWLRTPGANVVWIREVTDMVAPSLSLLGSGVLGMAWGLPMALPADAAELRHPQPIFLEGAGLASAGAIAIVTGIVLLMMPAPSRLVWISGEP